MQIGRVAFQVFAIMFRWLTMLIVVTGAVTCRGAEEWNSVPEDEAQELKSVAESALEAHWQRSRRGWCRALLEHYSDQVEFTLWWDGNRTGLEVESVILGRERDSKIRPPEPRLAVYLPDEQWIFTPKYHQCQGYSGRQAQRLPSEYEIHPHKVWLSMLGGQKPRYQHLNRLRKAGSDTDPLRVSRNDAGLVRFDTRQMGLVLDSQRGFTPVQAEFQTKLDEVPNPKVMLPIREDYKLAQDSHGEWYCQQMIRTSWPRGGQGEPGITYSALIVEYDSQPAASLLRLSLKEMTLPTGTSVQSRAPSRTGRWIVGREKEGEQALTEERFRELGKILRARGFAAEDEP